MDSRATTADLSRLVNDGIDEIEHRATSDSTFDDLELDSLVFVEMAVILSNHYKVHISESDVAEAADFKRLAEFINNSITESADSSDD